MQPLTIDQKQIFSLPDFLFWVILAIAFPLSGGHFSFFNISHIIIYLCGVFFVGQLFFHRINSFREMPFLIRSGVYIILGGIISGLLFIILPSKLVLYIFFAFFLADLVKNRSVCFAVNWQGMLCLLPFLVLLFQSKELVYGREIRYEHWDGDYYYYTAITESLKTNQSLRSAVFHIGLPIAYSPLPFLAPAQLANFSGISSQFALWGMYMKLIPVMCFGSIAYVIVKLFELYFRQQLNNNQFIQRMFFVGLLLLFLGPIHFLNLVKFDFEKVLFLGEGYLLPTGSPGFALAMFLGGISILVALSETRYTLYHKAGIVALLSFAAASKLALFLPLIAVLGVIAVFGLFKKEADLLIALLIAVPCCLLVYKFTIGGSDSVLVTRFTIDGYFQKYFTDLASKYGIGGSTTMKLIGMALISFFMWLSIKLAILIIAGADLYKNNKRAFVLIPAAILTLFVSALPGFFVDSKGVDSSGKVLFDASFDMGQFLRGGSFILTIIALIFALYLVYVHHHRVVRRISSVVFIAWMCIIFPGFFAMGFELPGPAKQDWYLEVKQDFEHTKPTLMAMMGNIDQSGQTATTAGVHPWFCTGIREDGEGFMFPKAVYDRNYAVRKIFQSDLDISERKHIADSIRQLGVDCFVASPSSMEKIRGAVRDSILSPIPGTKWFYRFN